MVCIFFVLNICISAIGYCFGFRDSDFDFIFPILLMPESL